MRKGSQRYTKGITLMELLIVIAIIGSLVGISIPVTRSMVAKGQESACLANLRQIGVAVELYLGDNSRVLPDLEIGRADRSAEVDVIETVLIDYLESEDAFHCPADHEHFAESGCSYNWNHTQSGRSVNEMSFFGEDKPERIPLVSDKEDWHPSGTNILYADFSITNEVRFITREN